MLAINVINVITMWYFLQSILNKPNTFIEINGSYNNITEYFLSNIENKIFIDNVRLSAITQSGFTKKKLLEVDYLHDIRMGNIPVFSKKFVDAMSKHLHQIVNFYPCTVLYKGDEYLFYMSKIRQILPVIDKNASGYRTLTDGSKILDEPVIIKQEIDQSLLVIRDADYKSIVVVSNLFKEIVEREKLNVKFYNSSQTFW